MPTEYPKISLTVVAREVVDWKLILPSGRSLHLERTTSVRAYKEMREELQALEILPIEVHTQ